MQTDFCKLKYVYSIMFIYAMLYKFRLTAAVICLIIIVMSHNHCEILLVKTGHFYGR